MQKFEIGILKDLGCEEIFKNVVLFSKCICRINIKFGIGNTLNKITGPIKFRKFFCTQIMSIIVEGQTQNLTYIITQ